MTIISPSSSLDAVVAPQRGRSLLQRFFDAVMEGRQRKATAGLADYLHNHRHSLDAEVRSVLERRLEAQGKPAARTQRSIAGALVALIGLVAVSTTSSDAVADPEPTTFPLVCALKEVKVITALEEHGDAQDVPSDSLADAAMAMLRARATCYEGRVGEAVALYDGILNLGPVVAVQKQ